MPITAIRLKIPPALQKALHDPKTAVNKQFQSGIEKMAITIQGEVKKNIIPGWNMGHAIKATTHFTGKLNRSITYAMGPLKAAIGANVVDYGPIQEEGGTIRPKTAKALFIPISVKGVKVGPVKGGGSGLVYGEDFIFMQKVTIKPKKYMARGLEASLPKIEKILNEVVTAITKEAGFK